MIRLSGWESVRPWAALLVVGGVLLVLAIPAAVIVPLVARMAAQDVTDGTGVAAPAPAAIAKPVAAKAVSSAVTVKGTGSFATLEVTVAQTSDLINQTVQVAWSGGRPTHDGAAFDVDYLQIMQCWGDGAAGPERTQCQFGGNAAFDNRGGQNTASRQLNTPSYKDTKDPLVTKAAAGADVFVPFVSVTDVTVKGQDTLKNPFYDNTTTNELTYGRTRGDGKGAVLFEMLTYREAPGLGCGQLLTSGTRKGQPRACWLVVVPRGDVEVDGAARAAVLAGSSHRLDTSPLSSSNWANRLVVPLSFVAVGNACPIAAAQKQTTGVETATEAVLRWQPALCRNNGPVFGFAQSPDATADRTLKTDSPGMVFLNGPASAAPSDRLYTYAPIALSGLVIGVTLDRQSPTTATEAQRAGDGAPITDVNLTPRLVAKLLTQSYLFGAPGNGSATYLQKNVDNITKDPDFLAVNPALAGTAFGSGVSLISPIGLASSTDLLWQWVGEDPDAADFLAGLPDPWGMRVNPFYQGTSTPRQDFPKIDPYCSVAQKDAPPLCSLDEHPYAQDLHESARSAARGDSLARTFWDANAKPPTWKKRQLQLNGRRQLFAVTDNATAQRYGLVVAKLRNASGVFVAPTSAALLAAASVMRATGVAGVLAPDPQTSSKAAYPLPLVTYAVTPANLLTKADATAFAAFVRFAAGTGQTSGSAAGTLPGGYAPLPKAWRATSIAAATAIAARKGPKVVAVSTATTKTTTGTRATSTRTTGTTAGSGSNPTAAGAAGGAGPSAATTGTPSVDPAGTSQAGVGESTPTLPQGTSSVALDSATAATSRTPDEPAGSGRYALVTALTLGLAALLVGPAMPRLARRLRQ